jgi:ELWxxDGT repeat protein
MKKLYSLILLLLITFAVQSQYVQKVTSINYYGYNGLNPSNITVFNDKLFFFGTDDLHYVDKLMYTADGSAEGVTVVKQIDTIKQYPSLQHLTVLNNLLIFNNSNQLWKSDGTTAGTSSIATLKVGSPNFVVLNNKVFFTADNTNSYPINDQLWQTDGTAAGTKLVKTINSSGPSYIGNLFVSGGKIYFRATDGVNQEQLWISDGSEAGTYMLKRLNPTGDSYPNYFTEFNGKVYFSGEDGVTGSQICLSDGTTAGTTEVTTLNPGSIGLSPSTFTVFNSKLYFMGLDHGVYYQLWSTDGTAAGTLLVKTDYTPRTYAGFIPNSMVVHNNKLYMSGYDSLTGTVQLWVSDGTTAGTTKVTHHAHGLYPSKLYSYKSRIIMTGYDTISNEEQLFASDGTAAGTVCPTPPDTWGQYPFYPWESWVPFNNALYFRGAYAYFADYQLCRYTEQPSGIEQQEGKQVTVYPNPNDGSFQVVVPTTEHNSNIEIFNSLGVLIYHQPAEAGIKTIILPTIPKGIYILKVLSDQKTLASQKIMKK